jgi:leucyl-tRNA synthetase
MANYPFKTIEPKWQKYWQDKNIYRTEDDFSKPKYYILDMFPYPSGAGLHIGHPEGYTATDIIARYKRMKGFNVLHPMGFDAFGLPTERYCMTTGKHPIDATATNIGVFTRQLDLLGLGYDWNRLINTTDPNYYKWTQWMFLLIYNSWYDETLQKARPIDELPIPEDIKDQKEIDEYIDSKRLAFISMIPVNWCEELGTVLANEEVDEWREKGYSVERRPMRQWMIKITTYAQRLLDDLDLVNWPHSTLEMQKNWIGKSEGAEIDFEVFESNDKIRVFTTRPDTIFGATYMVLAPEHPLVNGLTTVENKQKIADYIHTASFKSDLERTELNKDKSGVFTGAYAVNPATGNKVPIWIADYVLAQYGTGAIMAVPGHDERDHEFALQYGLPILQVVAKSGSDIDITKEAFCEDGLGVNSTNDDVSFNGLNTHDAKKTACEWIERKGIGKSKIQFKLRDWLFSRQRYWGEPIPIMYFEDGSRRSLDADELPLTLPPVVDFQPAGTGESPLAKIDSWVNFIDKKTGKKARFETNTMPQWAGSCWYYLRYIDPNNTETFASVDKEKYWMDGGGIDLYVGGAEHAVLHLLYARFWHKVLFDYNLVSTPEPFKRLFHQGLIMGEDGRKMSKSLGNVINPDDVVAKFGADSLRMFEMFLGPLQDSKPWSETGIEGVYRFLNRVWRLIADEEGNLLGSVQNVKLTTDQEFVLHSTIKKIADDIEDLKFNTAVSQMMIFVNEFNRYDIKPLNAMKDFVLCLSPFAPHICEELWRILGNTDSVVLQSYPDYDENKIVKQSIEMVIQVTSKIRSKMTVAPGMTQEQVQELALADVNVQKFMENKPVRKVIFVQDKLINIIV